MKRLNLNKPIITCSRCGNNWNPRKYRPKECPKCKSPDWNKPKIKKTTMPSPITKTITKTTTTLQVGIVPSPTLGIVLPSASLEHKKEVVKKD